VIGGEIWVSRPSDGGAPFAARLPRKGPGTVRLAGVVGDERWNQQWESDICKDHGHDDQQDFTA
jgi:hypothetical protein